MKFEKSLKKLADRRVRLGAELKELESRIARAEPVESHFLREEADKIILKMAGNADHIRRLVDSNLGNSVQWNYYDQRLPRP